MSGKGKKVKSVAFQLQDPMEFKMYYYSKKYKQFSTYIKRLIQRDMEQSGVMFNKEWDKAYQEYLQTLEEELS